MSSELVRQIRAAAVGPPAKALAPSTAFIKRRVEVWLFRSSFTNAFLAFHCHFEARPVLPALAQVLTAKDCAQAVLGRKRFIDAPDHGQSSSVFVPGCILSFYSLSPSA